jgi:hypothetical protein
MEEKFFVRCKMASEIQNGSQFSMGCDFILQNIFPSALLHCVCVKNGKKIMEKICILLKDGATRLRGRQSTPKHSPENLVNYSLQIRGFDDFSSLNRPSKNTDHEIRSLRLERQHLKKHLFG